MLTDKNGHEITSEDVEELENKLSIALKALESVISYVHDNEPTMGQMAQIVENALKEIQQHDLPDFARFENRSNITTDVDK